MQPDVSTVTLDQPDRISIPEEKRSWSIADFAYQRQPDLSGRNWGLSVRLANVLKGQKISAFGHLDGITYADFRRLKNCGSKTVNELRILVSQLVDETSTSEQETVSGAAPSDARFVQCVDWVVAALPQRSRDIVLRRFADGIRTVRVAEESGLSRERVRQIEEKFVSTARRSLDAAGVSFERASEDGVIEFDELNPEQAQPANPQQVYVAVARTLAIGGDSYVDTEHFYSGQLDAFIDELEHDDNFVLGRVTLDGLRELLYACAPPLREVPADEVFGRLRNKASLSERGATVLGRKPAKVRIISALLRRADGRVSISVLLRQIEMVLAVYGETSYFDIPRLRDRLRRMPGVHLLDQNNVSLRRDDPHVATEWQQKAVARITASPAPVSLVRFIRENPDCPFDVYALASLLKDDPRVVLAGRRLYAPATFDADRSLRVAGLIADALVASARPMTRRELLAHVRRHRDLVCGQVENYFPKVQGLQNYTVDIVGLVALDRHVMLQMLSEEACLLSLLGRRERRSPVPLSEIWLLHQEDPDLEPTEVDGLVRASRRWKEVSLEVRGGRVFYKLRESQ